ncbi:L-Proline/Glycine betaine transporter ProP [uncultured Candidatus Thioglobus sp.]|nr:L-Proline/Glycine betaine transporter ProP [uncultured Candidatus Thioglobus sp.]
MQKEKFTAQHIIASSINNTIEWYDFSIYGYFAITMAALFFPTSTMETSLLIIFATFASGYLARPFGAIIFGHFSDKIGRKKILSWSIAMMAITSAFIAVLPTYESAGIYAGVLLLLFRILGGLSMGGASSASYVVEKVKKNRVLTLSFLIIGATVGFLLGSLVSIGLHYFLSEADLMLYGWRIAFFISLILGILGIILRMKLPYLAPSTSPVKVPFLTLMKYHKRQILENTGLNLVGAVLFYSLFIYVTSWLTQRMHLNAASALDINLYALIILGFSLALGGYLGDRISKRYLAMAVFSSLIILVYPLFWLMGHHSYSLVFIGEATLALLLGLLFPAILMLQLENFPKKIRASGSALSYNITWGVFGVTAPLVASWITLKTHQDLVFTYYIIALAIISLIAVISMPEKHQKHS